jgi:hypothetical protein
MKITVKAPRKKNGTVQCKRCQCYGHTKTYCARTYICVKFGGELQQNVPLCGGNHLANYKGCDIYKNLQEARSRTTIQ